MISSRACLSLQSKGHKSFKQKIKQEMFSDKLGSKHCHRAMSPEKKLGRKKNIITVFQQNFLSTKKPTGYIYMSYTLGLFSELVLHYAISSSQLFTLHLPDLISQVTIYSHHLVIVGEVVVCSLAQPGKCHCGIHLLLSSKKEVNL